MASFVYDVAEEAGYDPCLVCNVLDSEIDVRLQDVATFNWTHEIEHKTVNGMELKGIPRILPEFEFFQYVSNRHLWEKALEDGDVYFGVGGSNHCCLPLLFEGERFGSWTATLFWEDRRDRLRSASVSRRVRDRVSRPIMEHLEGMAYEAAEPIFVLSDYTAQAIVNRYGIDRERITVVPYPIDTEMFHPNGNIPDELNDNRPTVLFVGRFNDPRKNVESLIEAVHMMQSDVPDIRLLLVGDDPDDRVQSAISDHELDDAVRCIAYLENTDLPAYYRAADAFTIPSRQEGLAIVGLEAMACGTPVVATRCGGPEEYVINDETGYLVPKDDVGQLANRVKTILISEEYREQLGQNARRTVEANYARKGVAKDFKKAVATLANRQEGQV